MATLCVPHPLPSPAEDAEQLRKACQGWGTDEKAVIMVLAHRDSQQRKQIRAVYEERYKENLVKRLESELSGDFERALQRWTLDPVERAAIIANVAVKKRDIDFRVIIEIACVDTPDELFSVKKSYQARYKRSLEEDVASNSSGDLRKFLVALVGTYRYDGPEIDEGLASSEAKLLHEALKDNNAFVDHDEICRILTTRSKAQLNATLNRYNDDFGISITKMIRTVRPSDELLSAALRTAIRCFVSPHKHFAKVLRKSTNKAAWDADALSRVVVTRAEKDLGIIKEMYLEKNNTPLEHAVGTATSGDYKSFLLALLGIQRV